MVGAFLMQNVEEKVLCHSVLFFLVAHSHRPLGGGMFFFSAGVVVEYGVGIDFYLSGMKKRTCLKQSKNKLPCYNVSACTTKCFHMAQ